MADSDVKTCACDRWEELLCQSLRRHAKDARRARASEGHATVEQQARPCDGRKLTRAKAQLRVGTPHPDRRRRVSDGAPPALAPPLPPPPLPAAQPPSSSPQLPAPRLLRSRHSESAKRAWRAASRSKPAHGVCLHFHLRVRRGGCLRFCRVCLKSKKGAKQWLDS
eukprot:1488724-Pleurochrysis_carterae.AAC.4